MKNVFTKIRAVAAAFILASAFCLLTPSASAQGDFDFFAYPRPVQLAQLFTNGAAGGANTGVTNQPVDIHLYTGIANLLANVVTNDGATIVTLTVQTSPDRTNWVTLTNYAAATQYSIAYTNGFYGGTALSATNVEEFAGTRTFPAAATAGFATPYVLPAQFTNGGAMTLANGLNSYGFIISDANWYVRTIWTCAGKTNYAGDAVLIARKQQ